MDLRAVLSSCMPGVSSTPSYDYRVRSGVAIEPPHIRRDEAFFQRAAAALQMQLLLSPAASHCPPTTSQIPLRPIESVADTRVDFSAAVLSPVVSSLSQLTGQSWSYKASMEETDDEVLCDNACVGTVSYLKLPYGTWNKINAYVDAPDGPDSHGPDSFRLIRDVWGKINAYFGALDDGEEEAASILRHIWTQSERLDRPCILVLSTYIQTMILCRARGSDVLLCSREYCVKDSGKHSVRFVLAASLLAVTNALRDDMNVNVASPQRRASELYQATSNSTFPNKEILILEADLDNFIMPLRAFSRAGHDGFPRPENIILPPEPEADIIIRELIQYTRIGFVVRGVAHGVPVYLKFCYRVGDWELLLEEREAYASFARAGFADFVPPIYGMWHDDTRAFLVTGEVGFALEKWADLNEEQWDAFTRRLHELHKSGFHHGDLEPRNVCLAADGRVRLIDLGSVEDCDCHDDSCDTECSEMETLRNESGRKIGFDTTVYSGRS
ncbi:hypothetical protein EXIGLDRAFT_722132 [Exidia glandulosa HHB12029]|uniref:Protein kinase domain-containing protein n=1 Tax=Exidia glandulosa HHB12029 TaxID=1314781 RepID=A0A165FER0_EXIGL|nr:hypothetical protein EXIGLDRAFT_722132 [Exidia glandulosa HHB12029]